MAATLATSIPYFPPPKIGKVREVYDIGEHLLLVATDRISAFDVVMQNGIPDKGRVLNQLSAFWFETLNDICPNHIVSTNDDEIGTALAEASHSPFSMLEFDLNGRSTLAKKASPLPIECVARGYISGSLFKEYRASGGDIHDLNLPPGLLESARLSEPIFTPATKAEHGHDENLSWNQAVDLVGKATAEIVRDWTLRIYSKAADIAATKGIILADTKFEFGETADGLIWIDEALTPDSSRFWVADKYEPGHAQASFDKQFVRDYLESIDWNKQPPGPRLPDEIVAKTREKYLEAFRLLTGRELAV